MTSLRLKRIRVRNWAKFSDIDLEFPEYGLVAVSGRNTASEGRLMSVGSGKTALGEAICRALFGVQTRFAHMKEASKNGGGNTLIQVDALLDGRPLRVENGYRHAESNPSGEGLKFVLDGKEIQRGTIAQTRADLNAVLGMSPELANWTVFVDGDRMKFNALDQDKAVEVVMTALNQPPWSQFHEKAKKTLTQLRKDLATVTGEVQVLTQTVARTLESIGSGRTLLEKATIDWNRKEDDRLKRLASLESDLTAASESLQEAEAAQAEIKAKIQNLADTAAIKAKSITEEMDRTYEELERLRYDCKLKTSDESTVKSEVALAEKAYRDLTQVRENCPTCGKKWHEMPAKDKVDAARKEVEEARKKHSVATRARESVESKIGNLEQVVAGLRNKMASTNTGETKILSAQFRDKAAVAEKATPRYRSLEASRIALQVLTPQTEIIAARAVVQEREASLRDAESNLETKKTEQNTAKECVNLAEYWCAAYSPSGIPNLILKQSIAPLNLAARRIAKAMTGGTLSVEFSTSKALVSGESRANLNVSVNNALGSSNSKLSSKGESGLTNFIIAETLSAVGKVTQRFGFKWYDEVVPHQDAVVCQSLYAYLKELARRERCLIFIVDHNPAVSEFADHFLEITKSGTGEACVSTAAFV